MREDQRQRVGLGRADVQEVDRLTVDLGDELRQFVQPRLVGAPVEAVGPVGGQALEMVERDAAAPTVARRSLRPARAGQAVCGMSMRKGRMSLLSLMGAP